MSVKSDTIFRLWPGGEQKEFRMLAFQRPEIGEAVASYCDLRRAGQTPEFAEHFADAKAAVEAAFAAGARQRYTGSISRRNAFLRGDDERYRVDDRLGEGAYDSEFVTDGEIDDAMSR